MEIDSLVVSLSLDPRQFNAAQKQSIDQLRKFEQEAKGAAAGVESSTQKMVGGFDRVTKEILGLGAALLGVNGIKDLIVSTTQATSALGINAKALGVSTQFLSQWQSAARLAGVDAATSAASIGALVKSIANLQITGQGIREAFPQLAALGITNVKDAGDLLKQLNEAFQKPQAPGVIAALADAIPGIAGLLPLLQQTPAKLNEYLSKAGGLTGGIEQQAKAAREVASAWDEAQQSIEKIAREFIKINELPLVSGAHAIVAALHGDTAGLSKIDEQIGASAAKGREQVGSWIWDFLSGPKTIFGGTVPVRGPDFIGPPQFIGPLQPSFLPTGRSLPPEGQKIGDRFEPPHLSLPGTPYGGGATPAGGSVGGSSSTDNSRNVTIGNVTVVPPPGADAATFAQRFNAAIEAQTGPR